MDKDDQIMSIGDAIDKYLSNDYTIQSKVINFKKLWSKFKQNKNISYRSVKKIC